jgi:flagellar motility protein MotE (MotC chaperone)
MKKRLIVLIGVGLVSFGVTFGLSLWLREKPVPRAQADPNAPAPADDPVVAKLSGAMPPGPTPPAQQLDDLVKELRAKIDECRVRAKQQDNEAKRLEMARQLLAKDAEALEQLRVQVAAQLPKIREARADLDREYVLIRSAQAGNLKRNAAVFEKMKADEAAKIFTGMCADPKEVLTSLLRASEANAEAGQMLAKMSPTDADARLLMDRIAENNQRIAHELDRMKGSGQEGDVVATLFYMSERAAAKILGAMDGQLAARLCAKLRDVKELSGATKEG